ncbi:MAG TPA: hypothetical protein VGF39_04105 [Stellaceae bacterium]|jgi:hypothetical protein
MAETGHKQALADVVREARAAELRRLTEDLDQLELFELFEAPRPSNGAPAQVVAQRGPGRPVGARNKRTDEAARFYKSRFGDPLARGVEISALPILAPGVLPELAKVLGCDRFEAARWWSGVYAATMPYCHQRLATLTVKPPGSPEGEPVTLPWSFAQDEVLEHLELVSDMPRSEEEP